MSNKLSGRKCGECGAWSGEHRSWCKALSREPDPALVAEVRAGHDRSYVELSRVMREVNGALAAMYGLVRPGTSLADGVRELVAKVRGLDAARAVVGGAQDVSEAEAIAFVDSVNAEFVASGVKPVPAWSEMAGPMRQRWKALARAATGWAEKRKHGRAVADEQAVAEPVYTYNIEHK